MRGVHETDKLRESIVQNENCIQYSKIGILMQLITEFV